MDEVPMEVKLMFMKRLDIVEDKINYIEVITHTNELYDKYKNKQLTVREIKLIEYFIPFNYIPHFRDHFRYYEVSLFVAYAFRIIRPNIIDFKSNDTNHPTSSIKNRRWDHNYFKHKLLILNYSEDEEEYKLMIRILNHITSSDVDQVCTRIEFLLYHFYIEFVERKNITKKEDVITSINSFFDLFNGDEQASNCETCKLFIQ